MIKFRVNLGSKHKLSISAPVCTQSPNLTEHQFDKKTSFHTSQGYYQDQIKSQYMQKCCVTRKGTRMNTTVSRAVHWNHMGLHSPTQSKGPTAQRHITSPTEADSKVLSWFFSLSPTGELFGFIHYHHCWHILKDPWQNRRGQRSQREVNTKREKEAIN